MVSIVEQQKGRNTYIDIIKGFAIILVVLGHSIQFGSGYDFRANAECFDNWLYRIIYSFHMPLFMIGGGYLAAITISRKSPLIVIKSRIKSLVVPAIAWSTVFKIYDIILDLTSGSKSLSVFLVIKSYIKSCLFDLWFLWAVLFCTFLVLIGKYVFKDSILYYAALVVGALFITDNWNFHLYKFNFPFFVIGYLWSKDNFTERILKIEKKKICAIYFITLIAYIALMTQYNSECFIYTSKYAILGKDFCEAFHQIAIDLYRGIVALLGIILVLGILFALRKWLPVRLLSQLSMDSLCIYCLSSFLNGRLLMQLTSNLSLHYGYVLLETVFMLVLTVLVSNILKRNSVTRKLFLGGR